MNKQNKKMFSLEISDELKDKLRIYAFRNKLTLSAAVRKILVQYLEDIIDDERTKTKMEQK